MSLTIAWAPRENVESKHTKVWHNGCARSESILINEYSLVLWRTDYCPPAAQNTSFLGQQWAADLSSRTHMTEKVGIDTKRKRICRRGRQCDSEGRQRRAAATPASRYTALRGMKRDRPGRLSKATYFSLAYRAESHANGTANFKVLQRYFLGRSLSNFRRIFT